MLNLKLFQLWIIAPYSQIIITWFILVIENKTEYVEYAIVDVQTVQSLYSSLKCHSRWLLWNFLFAGWDFAIHCSPAVVGNNEAEWVRVLDSHRVMKSEGQRVRESALVSSQQKKKAENAHFSHCRKSHLLYVWMCGARYEEEWKKEIHSSIRPCSHLILTSISSVQL